MDPAESVSGSEAPYFVDMVKDHLLDKYSENDLLSENFRVYTTLDPSLQTAAATALIEGTAAVEARDGYRHPKMASLPADRDDYLQGLVVADVVQRF